MKDIGPINRWRNYKNIYSLCGDKCVACKKLYYPKKYLCTCGSRDFESYNFSGTGKLLTFTKIMHTTKTFEKSLPYYVGIVELDEGVKILAQITDSQITDSQIADVKLNYLKIGMPVRAVFRKLYEDGPEGVVTYGVKFVTK